MEQETERHHRARHASRGIRVEVVEGPNKGAAAAVEEDTLTIGTAPGNTLVVTDTTVSRHHLELRREREAIVIEDMGSTNGTAIGACLVERATLLPGAVLELGRTRVRVSDGEEFEEELASDEPPGALWGRSPSMRLLLARVRRAAATNAGVLVLGETGSGKEVTAETIHQLSARRDGPFETVDCGSLLPTLVANELFGHERGAYTGADAAHVGAFERANGGTLFLDEIGELSRENQAALLGALERRTIRGIGGSEAIPVDVRVVAATHRDLRADVNSGAFRQDLYFRLSVVVLRVPPLRERRDDIPHLIERFAREFGVAAPSEFFSAQAMAALVAHTWPGNVRELRNFVEATIALGEAPDFEATSGAIDGPAGPSLVAAALQRTDYHEARRFILGRFNEAFAAAALAECKGNVSEAARRANVSRTFLLSVLKKGKRSQA